jgi:hypothetical protein
MADTHIVYNNLSSIEEESEHQIDNDTGNQNGHQNIQIVEPIIDNHPQFGSYIRTIHTYHTDPHNLLSDDRRPWSMTMKILFLAASAVLLAIVIYIFVYV